MPGGPYGRRNSVFALASAATAAASASETFSFPFTLAIISLAAAAAFAVPVGRAVGTHAASLVSPAPHLFLFLLREGAFLGSSGRGSSACTLRPAAPLRRI